MKTRPLLLAGLALTGLAGCQSYFPNGYGGPGPYSAFPPETYGSPPPGTMPPRTYQPGRMPPSGPPANSVPPLRNESAPPGGDRMVPNPTTPGSDRAPLGADGDEETIRRPTGRLDRAPNRLDGPSDDPDAALSALGDPDFSPPREIRAASAIDESDGDEIPRVAARPRPNPYKFDSDGYTWLRGTVSRDPDGAGWRLKYSDNPLDDDRFGGSLMIVGDDKIDNLLDDDVIVVTGRVDHSSKDRNGKPTYRVDTLKWCKPRQN